MLRGLKCVLAMAALMLGCMSPTLPLPPPAAPQEEAGAPAGMVKLHGASLPPSSTVIIYNLNPQTGEVLDDTQKVTATLVRDDGTWDATIFALKGDTVTIYDIEEGEWSPSTTYTITN